MIKIENITTDPFQRHLIIFNESEIEVNLRFYPRAQFWTLDAVYKEKAVSGFKLSCGVTHMISSNLPFDFYVEDNSGEGIDPFSIDDFENERCTLYLLEAADMVRLRGQGVEI